MKIEDNNEFLIDEVVDKGTTIEDLEHLSRPTISELCSADDGNLLIFPQSLGAYGDDINDKHIFRLYDNDRIETNNIMGFVGYKSASVSICSRFTPKDKKDYFLHYMLEKVFSINLFDLNYKSDQEQIFDFLIFMFPHFLNKALTQGLYKEYQTRRYNDCNVKGRIDVNRHIRLNIPFRGNVAYETREFSFDNHVTELIRHTIEYISTKDFGQNILSSSEETAENVRLIKEATSKYTLQERLKVMSDNLRPVVHPYFYEYSDLQEICLMILRHEELKYGEEKDKIHGILFDGAWLWEEYLNTILNPIGFKHPQNKIREGAIYLFEENEAERYPDFYSDNFVLDAKYKRYENRDIAKVDIDDLNQVLSYMWILQIKNGGFVFPCVEKKEIKRPRKLAGYEGYMGLYGIAINQDAESYEDFKDKMRLEEDNFVENIKSQTL